MNDSPDRTEGQLIELDAYLRQQPDVVLAYLFGSQARGQSRAGSDLDLGVVLEDNSRTPLELLERRLELAEKVEDIFRIPVDVVLLNHASLLLQGEVLREGQLLYTSNKEAQVDYEAYTRALCFDFQPRLRQHREALLQRLPGGESDPH